MNIYIISNFGPSAAMQEKRTKFHTKQLRYIRNNWPNAIVVVNAQNYSDDQYSDKVSRYVKTGKLNTASARNLLLEEFYASNEDWALFLDDDCIFDDRMHPTKFTDALMNGDFNETDAAIITPLFGRFTPIHGKILDNETILRYNFLLKSAVALKTSAFFIRNIKKYHRLGLYFDQRLDTLVDTEFGLRAHTLKLKQYNNLALSAIDLGNSVSALMEYEHAGKESGTADSRHDDNHADIIAFYKDRGLIKHKPETLTIPYKGWVWDFEYSVNTNGKNKRYDFIRSEIAAPLFVIE